MRLSKRNLEKEGCSQIISGKNSWWWLISLDLFMKQLSLIAKAGQCVGKGNATGTPAAVQASCCGIRFVFVHGDLDTYLLADLVERYARVSQNSSSAAWHSTVGPQLACCFSGSGIAVVWWAQAEEDSLFLAHSACLRMHWWLGTVIGLLAFLWLMREKGAYWDLGVFEGLAN